MPWLAPVFISVNNITWSRFTDCFPTNQFFVFPVMGYLNVVLCDVMSNCWIEAHLDIKIAETVQFCKCQAIWSVSNYSSFGSFAGYPTLWDIVVAFVLMIGEMTDTKSCHPSGALNWWDQRWHLLELRDDKYPGGLVRKGPGGCIIGRLENLFGPDIIDCRSARFFNHLLVLVMWACLTGFGLVRFFSILIGLVG